MTISSETLHIEVLNHNSSCKIFYMKFPKNKENFRNNYWINASTLCTKYLIFITIWAILSKQLINVWRFMCDSTILYFISHAYCIIYFNFACFGEQNLFIFSVGFLYDWLLHFRFAEKSTSLIALCVHCLQR